MTTGNTAPPKRPNFFILLGLNPDAPWNDKLYEDALKEKRSFWSRQSSGVGKKAIEAQANLKLYAEIKAVMADDARRAAEAVEARTKLAEGQQKRRDEFDKQLAFIEVKGSIEQAELDKFIEDFKDVFSQQEILKRLHDAKVVIGSTSPQKVIPPLEASKAKEIADRLEFVGKATLYEFLQQSRTVATPVLLKAAEDLYKDLVSRTANPDVTAKMELAGLAQTIFKTEEMRTRYDETVRFASLNRLLKELDDIMNRSTNKELVQGQIALFLTKAQKEGWKEAEAFAKLVEHARQRKWLLMGGPSGQAKVQRLLCGTPGCETLNDATRSFCTACGEALYADCPDCGELHISCEENVCGKCGFPVGNRYQVNEYLKEALAFLKGGELAEARRAVQGAKDIWKPKKLDTYAQKIATCEAKVAEEEKRQQEEKKQLEAKKAEEEKRQQEEKKRIEAKKAEEEKRQQQEEKRQQQEKQRRAAKAAEKLKALINQKKFFEAQRMLNTPEGAALPDQKFQQDKVNRVIARVEMLVRMIQVTPTLTYNQKIDRCREALALCSDYQDARNLLKSMPPLPPSNLQAKVSNDTTVSLSWNSSSTSGVGYIIVRKSGSRPNSERDGEKLGEVTGCIYDDTAPKKGLLLFYAVYAVIDDVVSPGEVLAKPVLLTEDVVVESVQIGDKLVSFRWRVPPNVHQIVLVRTTKTPPPSVNDTSRVELDPKSPGFTDQPLKNDQLYHFGIYCQYKDHQGKFISSTGTFVEATPEEPPKPLYAIDIKDTTEDTKRDQNHEIQITWQRPGKGNVVILKSSQALTQLVGQAIAEADVLPLGQKLIGGPDKATDIWTKSGIAYYTPIVIFQGTAYIGTSKEYCYVEEVRNVQLQNIGSAIRLKWDWPEYCHEVHVFYSAGDWPDLDDLNAALRVSKARYEQIGYYDLQGVVNQPYYIIMQAVIWLGDKKLSSRGIHSTKKLASQATVTYEIKNPGKLWGKRTLHISMRTPDGASSVLPALQLIYMQERLPFKKSEGILFQKIEPTIVSQKGLVVVLPEQKFPPRTFCKLFLEDDDEHERIIIHHPSMDKLRLS